MASAPDGDPAPPPAGGPATTPAGDPAATPAGDPAAASVPSATPVGRGPAPLAVLGAALGLLAAAAAVAGDAWPAWAGLPGAALLLAGGAAWPWLLRASPEGGSIVKVGLFGWLLAPPLLLAVALLARLAVPGWGGRPDLALGAALAVGALALLATPRGRLRVERPSRAGAVAIAVALGLGALTAAWLLQGSAARVSHHGLLHSGILLATERGVPPTNPWLGGEPLGYYWAYHALAALVARALSLAPTVALAWLNVWAAVGLALSLHGVAAVLYRDGKRELVALFLALAGLNALGGWLWLLGGLEHAVPTSAEALFLELRARLVWGSAESGFGWDPRLAFGLSKLGNVSSYPAALALGVGGLCAAAHALRHGARPWPWLVGATVGASAVVNPLVGGVVGGLVAACAVLAGPTTRAGFATLLALAIGLAPGARLFVLASAAHGGDALAFGWYPEQVGSALWPTLPLLVPALAGAWWLRRSGALDEGRRRPVLALLLLASLAPLAALCVADMAYDNEYKLARIAALPLGLLAGGGLVETLARGGAARAVGAALALVLGVGALAGNALGVRSYLELARVELPLEERPLELLPAARGDDGYVDQLRAAYAFLRRDPRVRESNPLLAVDPTRVGSPPFGPDPGHAFVDAFNKQGHEAPAFAALDLVVDRPSQVLAPDAPGYAERHAALVELFTDERVWSARTLELLWHLPRPVVVLISVRERVEHRTLQGRLEQRGFRTVWSKGATALVAWPREFADRFADRSTTEEGGS